MKRPICIALPITVLVGFCAPVGATAFSITLSGTIATGADDLGLFGPAHRSMAGDVFSVRYVIDPVSMITSTDADGVSPLYRFDTPGRMTVTVTIDGRSFLFAGSAQSVYQKTDHAALGSSPAFSRIDFQAYDGTNSLAESATAADAPPGALVAFPAGALEHSSLNLSLFGGAVRASSQDMGTISIQAVPEPSSWALMLGGFGAIGGALRRRKTSAWRSAAVDRNCRLA